MVSLIDVLRYHTRVLAAKSSALSVIHHAGTRGTEREQLLEDLVQDLLPESVAIGRGEIKAANGTWSRQEDLILYDRLNCPRLFVGSRAQVFPVESVAAVIEVKSSLRSKDIADATNNIREARRLIKSGLSAKLRPGSLQFAAPTPLLGCVFAYSPGLKPSTLETQWAKAQLELPPEERINLACVLDTVTIIHIDNVFHLWDTSAGNLVNRVMFLESGQDTLLTFALCLLRVLGEMRFGVPDLFRYYFPGDTNLEFGMRHYGIGTQ